MPGSSSRQRKSEGMTKKKNGELLEEMQDKADTMAFEEHAFLKEELEKHPEEAYKFELHQQQFDQTKERLREGTEILAETDRLEREKDDRIREREKRSANWILCREKYRSWKLYLYRPRTSGRKPCISGTVRIRSWYWKKNY